DQVHGMGVVTLAEDQLRGSIALPSHQGLDCHEIVCGRVAKQVEIPEHIGPLHRLSRTPSATGSGITPDWPIVPAFDASALDAWRGSMRACPLPPGCSRRKSSTIQVTSRAPRW